MRPALFRCFTRQDNLRSTFMRVHDTLEPLRGLRAARRQLIETGKLIGDGGYSRVISVNAFSVLKLTSCPQTQQLLDGLARLSRTKHPSGLPAVLDRWGPVAKDADGQRFCGYIVERLFEGHSLAERLRAKRQGFATIDARRRLQQEPFQVHLAELAALQEQLEGARERCLLGQRKAHLEHLQMAEQLSWLRLPGAMEETFSYLASFLKRTGGDLDLFQRGNILLDCIGRPVLADPVAEQTAEDAALPSSASQDQAQALVVRSVVALRGLEAQVEWDTLSLSDDRDALQSAAAELLATQGVQFEARVLPSGSEEHRRLIGEGRQTFSVWQLPATARRAALKPI